MRLNTTIEEATGSQVRLSDGTTVPTRTLVWSVGVTPGPLTQALGLDTIKGRIVVDEFLTVPGHPDVFAAGDAAAAPDLTRPGQLTAMTAQHAQRQGKAAARNVAATLGHGTRKPYKHRDLGTVVDLGGWQAVANPLHIPMSGPLASVITRGYHLYALPANRLRVATDWFNDIIEHRQFVQLGLIPSEYSGLTAAEHTDIYYQTDGQPLDRQQARINHVNTGGLRGGSCDATNGRRRSVGATSASTRPRTSLATLPPSAVTRTFSAPAVQVKTTMTAAVRKPVVPTDRQIDPDAG